MIKSHFPPIKHYKTYSPFTTHYVIEIEIFNTQWNLAIFRVNCVVRTESVTFVFISVLEMEIKNTKINYLGIFQLWKNSAEMDLKN